LLHDIGHGPFSHVIEKLLGFHHENWTVKIVADPSTQISQLLVGVSPSLPDQIVSVIEHRFTPRYVPQLVSSQLDVDRFDYLLRDSLMTGAKYGNFDLEWVLHALDLDPEGDRIYVSSKGLYAVEEYLQARYYMFRQVYFHRALRTAEVLLKNIFRRAVELHSEGRLRFSMPGSVMAKVLAREPLTTEEYLQLDDHDMMFFIKQWTGEEDPVVSDLARRFLNRRILKSIDLTLDGPAREEFIAQARSVVTQAGFNCDYYLNEDRASDSPYPGPYTAEDESPETRIYVSFNEGRSNLREITEVSPLVAGMRRFHLNRLCFPEEVHEDIERLLAAMS
jgi:hypothetical protein